MSTWTSATGSGWSVARDSPCVHDACAQPVGHFAAGMHQVRSIWQQCRMGSTASCAHHPFDIAEAIIISLLGGIDVCTSHVPGSHDLIVSRRWPHVEVRHPSLAELCKTLQILHAVHQACQHRHALLMPGGQLHSAAGPQAPTCCYQPQVLASCTHRSLSCGSNAVQQELANCSIMPLAHVTYTSSSPGCWVSPWQPCSLPAADYGSTYNLADAVASVTSDECQFSSSKAASPAASSFETCIASAGCPVCSATPGTAHKQQPSTCSPPTGSLAPAEMSRHSPKCQGTKAAAMKPPCRPPQTALLPLSCPGTAHKQQPSTCRPPHK